MGIMEFISRNAYIVTACKGSNFCAAAYEAFNFILDNVAQVALVNWISMFLLFLGKIFITAGTICLCLLMCEENDDISSVVMVLIVCGLVAYAIACMFLGVFETTIDTILVCFCWEQAAKGGFIGDYVYATEHLNCFIEGINVEAATNSEARQTKDATKVHPELASTN